MRLKDADALLDTILRDKKLDGKDVNWAVNRIISHILNAPTVERILCRSRDWSNDCTHSSSFEQGYVQGYEEGKNERHIIEPKRKFIRIITTYLPDDCICYKEYKGKPYFSIEYQKNGETIEGYGTYNPDVLSRFLRDYFFNER